MNATDPTGMQECTAHVPDPLVGDTITTWSFTDREVYRTELRSDGWYQIGAYVTTNYIHAHSKNWDGTRFDNESHSPGGSVAFDE